MREATFLLACYVAVGPLHVKVLIGVQDARSPRLLVSFKIAHSDLIAFVHICEQFAALPTSCTF
jgi:hypothetical protein